MFRGDATYPATFDCQRKAEVAPELRDTDVLLTFREKIEKVRFVPEADIDNRVSVEGAIHPVAMLIMFRSQPNIELIR